MHKKVIIMSIKFKVLSFIFTVLILILCFSSEIRKNEDAVNDKAISTTGSSYKIALPAAEQGQLTLSDYTQQDNLSDDYLYLNPDNIMIVKNNVTVSPLEIYKPYSENNNHQLFIKCRIYNGYDYEISNIVVDWMEINADNTAILYESNIVCKDLTIQPHQSSIYTFKFNDIYFSGLVDLKNINYKIYAHTDTKKSDSELNEESTIRSQLKPNLCNTYTNSSHPNSNNSINLSVEEAYYKDDKLILNCNIYNGYDFALTQIQLNWANLYSKDKLIAQGNFGTIYDKNINPHENVKCTIEIDYNCLISYNAELIDPYFLYYYSYKY